MRMLKIFLGNDERKSRILAYWLIGVAVSLLKKTAKNGFAMNIINSDSLVFNHSTW